MSSNTSQSPTEMSDENDVSSEGIIFSCRCDSAKAVTTLLSCLRNVSLSNNAGSGPSLYSMQEANASLLTSTTDRRLTQGTTSGGASRGSKIQYATVFCSDKSLTFQVYGVGRQSRATAEMNAGMFSEYFVSEQRIVSEDGEEEIVRGGEFGINLTTVLECLCVLGTMSLERIKLCLSYDSSDAIFKIELLEESNLSIGSLNGGVILSNIAIPAMSLADDDDDIFENDEFGHESGLDYAFRSHPIVARARVRSDFLRDSISELTDVAGAIQATVGISKTGLEFATFGHSTECHVVIPYAGNHPETFISLEGVGRDQKSVHARSFPMHLLLASMRGLEIAKETCISLNSNGMIAIQHQIFDKLGNGEPNYVDYIMSCLQDEGDDFDENDGMIMINSTNNTQTSIETNGVRFSPEENPIEIPLSIRQTPRKGSMRKYDSVDSVVDHDVETDSQDRNDGNLFGQVAMLKSQRVGSNITVAQRDSSKNKETVRINRRSGYDSDASSKSDSDFYENSFDVTAGFGKVSKHQTNPTDSPQLMYGDSRLDASDDEK